MRFYLLSVLVVCLALASAKPSKPNKGVNKQFGLEIPAPTEAKIKQSQPMASPPAKSYRDIDIDNSGTASENASDMFQGDIRLTQKQMKKLKQKGPKGRALRTATSKWANGVIPYQFDTYNGRSHTSADREEIIASMNFITTKTGGCLTFRPRTSTDSTYLSIINGDGCWSYVGNVFSVQQLSLQQHSGGSCLARGTSVHEFLHAAALMHEQSRQDRDDYVTINYQNMNRNYYSQFDKESGDYHNTVYDYYSIMHYGPYDFSTNGQPTIVPKDSSVVLKTSYLKTDAEVMTDSDILAIQRYYSCPETVTQTTTTRSGDTQTTTTAKTTTTTVKTNVPTTFRLRNDISGYTIYVYLRNGDTLYYQYSIRSGRSGPYTSAFVDDEYYLFTSDFYYYTYFTAGQGLFATSGSTVKVNRLQWYYY